MPVLSEMKLKSRPQKILVYGAPKSGKTLLAVRLAEQGYRVHLVDADNGMDVAFQIEPKYRHNIFIYSVRDNKDTREVAKFADLFTREDVITFCQDHGKVDCSRCRVKAKDRVDTLDLNSFTEEDVLVIDSITEVVNSVATHVARKDSYFAFDSIDKDAKPEWGHYMAQGIVLNRFFSAIQNAPYKVIAISHETELDPEKNKNAKLVFPVGGTSTRSKAVAKYFGHVVQCTLTPVGFKTRSSHKEAPLAMVGSRTNAKVSSSRGLADFFELDAALEAEPESIPELSSDAEHKEADPSQSNVQQMLEEQKEKLTARERLLKKEK